MSAVFDRLIKTHISLRLGDGSSLGALWELSGSSLGALWELVAVAGIISIDKITKTAVVKWEETQKRDTVHLADCKKYNELDVIQRKRKSTDFICEIPQTMRGKPPPGHMKNMFFSDEKSSKLCAKGAIQTY